MCLNTHGLGLQALLTNENCSVVQFEHVLNAVHEYGKKKGIKGLEDIHLIVDSHGNTLLDHIEENVTYYSLYGVFSLLSPLPPLSSAHIVT